MASPVRISEAASIAMHACLWLAKDPENFHPSREVCDELKCSQAHMAKVMQDLCRARLVESLRGPGGGVRLAALPNETTLLDIYEAVEGSLTVDDACLLPDSVCTGRNCILGKAIESLHNQFATLLKQTTLADICNSLPKEKK